MLFPRNDTIVRTSTRVRHLIAINYIALDSGTATELQFRAGCLFLSFDLITPTGTHRARSPLRAGSPRVAPEKKPPACEFRIRRRQCQIIGFACCCEEYGLAAWAGGQEKARNYYGLCLGNTSSTSNSRPYARHPWTFFRLPS